MVTAIVYTSETGHTRQYAELLGEATGLPVYSLKDSAGLAAGREIIYLGWLMAGKIQGLREARRRFTAPCVCGVGMSPATEALERKLRLDNRVLGTDQLFYLQGGYDPAKLNVPYRTVMKLICAQLRRDLAKRDDLTEGEQATLRMAQGAYSCVCRENIQPVASWYQSRREA